MSVLVRSVVYASLFVALFLVFLPARLATWSGVVRPTAIRFEQGAGVLAAAVGGTVSLWCVLTFALLGRGTPAVFDAPRRLVVRGPYGVVRNPMYLGATLALAGASLFYESVALAAYAAAFFSAAHAFVLWYEEPVLRRGFGAEYEAYCRRVRRWWPRLRAGGSAP